MLTVHVDTRDLVNYEKLLAGLRTDIQSKVLVRTLNRVGDTARTQTLRALAEQVGLKYGDVRSAVTRVGARSGGLAYELHSSGGYMTLARFSPTQTRTGVKARPWGRVMQFPHAFIVRKLPPLAFKRVSRERLPIKPLYGPALPKEMIKGASAETWDRTIRSALLPRLEHEIDYAIGQIKARLK